jgi:hypothetical protein
MPLEAEAAPCRAKMAGRFYPADIDRVNYGEYGLAGQFGAVAAIPPLRDRQMGASRSDRDRFRRLYIILTHFENRGGKGRSTRIQWRTASNDQSAQTKVPQQGVGGD